jgi:hypothetical protein
VICWTLDIGFSNFMKVGLPLGVTEKISPGGFASLYSKDQLPDGLNTFMSLISIIGESPAAVFLSHLGAILWSMLWAEREFAVAM